MLAAAEGRLDEAEAEFAHAVSIFRRYHTPFEEAATLRLWARVLATSGNIDRASEKFDAAVEVYRNASAGQDWIDRVGEERSRISPSKIPETEVQREKVTAALNEQPTSLVGEVLLRKEGDFWTITYAGTLVRMKDIKGLSYIARLMSHPNREFHALDLVAGAEGDSADDAPDHSLMSVPDKRLSVGRMRRGLGDAGEMLDASAKSAYRSRLTQLRQELEEAKELGNLDRAEKAESEIDKVSRELARAVGLFGRDRRAVSASERARLSVTRAIKSAIEAIAKKNPPLGRLLWNGVRTGTFCCYLPEQLRPKASQYGTAASENKPEAGSIDAVAEPLWRSPGFERSCRTGRHCYYIVFRCGRLVRTFREIGRSPSPRDPESTQRDCSRADGPSKRIRSQINGRRLHDGLFERPTSFALCYQYSKGTRSVFRTKQGGAHPGENWNARRGGYTRIRRLLREGGDPGRSDRRTRSWRGNLSPHRLCAT